MELDELQRRILHRQELERLESMPPKSYNPSEGMSPEEMSRYIQFLSEQAFVILSTTKNNECLSQDNLIDLINIRANLV